MIFGLSKEKLTYVEFIFLWFDHYIKKIIFIVLTMFCTIAIFNRASKRLLHVFTIDSLIRLVDCIIKFRLNVLFVIWIICFTCDLNYVTVVSKS